MGRVILLSIAFIVLLFIGALFHPDTAAVISKGTSSEPTKTEESPAPQWTVTEGAHPKGFFHGDKDEPPIERPEYVPAVDVKETDKFAFLIWLSESPEEDNEFFDKDDYFVACRVLLYQLLHDPRTKAASDIDVIVMAGPRVGEAHKERLRKDGAIVKSVEVVHGQHDEWIVPEQPRWGDIMGKLRAWEMEEYSRVVMLDGDMLLQSPLDGVFHDPDAILMQTKPGDSLRKDDEPDLPEEYLLCSFMEIQGKQHDWPPSDRRRFPGYFNAGFFMLKPSKKLFNYFAGLLDIENRFDPAFMEQNLLNYAHRWQGAMPWKEINGKWNTKFTTEADMDGGVVSMHEKFWKLRSGGQKLMRFADSKRWQAEGYWIAEREAEEAEKKRKNGKAQ
jgi:alpha-N-acetylglucosamine transferase